LQELHWLPIAQRIDYKLCLLVYKSRTGRAPVYVSDMLTPAQVQQQGVLSRCPPSLESAAIRTEDKDVLDRNFQETP